MCLKARIPVLLSLEILFGQKLNRFVLSTNKHRDLNFACEEQEIVKFEIIDV